MTMPFGKYKGVAIEDLPNDYLLWVYTREDLRNPLRAAVDVEWHARFAADKPANLEGFDDSERELLTAVLKSGFRALALRAHPDVGGDAEQMVELNRLMEKLRGTLL